jgi:hypothetical protein
MFTVFGGGRGAGLVKRVGGVVLRVAAQVKPEQPVALIIVVLLLLFMVVVMVVMVVMMMVVIKFFFTILILQEN